MFRMSNTDTLREESAVTNRWSAESIALARPCSVTDDTGLFGDRVSCSVTLLSMHAVTTTCGDADGRTAMTGSSRCV